MLQPKTILFLQFLLLAITANLTTYTTEKNTEPISLEQLFLGLSMGTFEDGKSFEEVQVKIVSNLKNPVSGAKCWVFVDEI
ncbi:MAG: hypothetical protein AB8B69_09360 [Chitinophagales bacterium]